MHKANLLISCLWAGIVVAVPDRSTAAPLYSITDLGTGYVRGLSDSGQVLGTDTSGGSSYLYQNGTYTSIPSSVGQVGAMNNAGQIASGTSIGALDASTGQVIDLQHIPLPASPYTPQAVAINSHGDVLIASGADTFLYQNGRVTDFAQLLSGNWITPISLDNAGHVLVSVTPLNGNGGASPGLNGSTQYLYQGGMLQALPGGWTVNGSSASGQLLGATSLVPNPISSLRAALFENGQAIALGTLGTQSGWEQSEATAMNSNGQVVGFSEVTQGNAYSSHAFLYQHGSMIDLNSLIPSSSGVTLSNALFINDRGQIIAAGTTQDGPMHNYLLMPTSVPEPGMLTVFGLAAALALRRARRSMT
jgi:probable HAF family extracellular repeat protein